MINQEFIVKWCERMEDPNEHQIDGRLEDASGGKCCLGVGSRVAVEMGFIEEPVTESTTWSEEDQEIMDGLGEDIVYTWRDENGYIAYEYERFPTPVWKAVGFDSGDPEVEITPEMSEAFDAEEAIIISAGNFALTECNDTYGLTFPMIARAVRHTYLDG